MPFKSVSQRRFMYAAEERGDVPKGTAKKWEEHTPKGRKLPERVSKKETEKTAFQLGFEKKANAFSHSTELLGLGILAAPNSLNLMHKPMSEKSKDIAEVGGLGILALPSIAHFAAKSPRILKAMPFIRKLV
jgi:hypothetical protein